MQHTSFRDEMLDPSLGYNPELSLLRNIWEEKRGREFIETEPRFSMAVCLDSPEYRADNVAADIVDFLASSDPELAYRWSSEWGQARIALAPRGSSANVAFIDRESIESKKYSPVFTSDKQHPSAMMVADCTPTEDPIWLLMNDDEPVSMEGAVLQIERMVDEAIWTACHYIEQSDVAHGADAYRLAVGYVQQRGVATAYASASDILDLKRSHPGIPVRLYGDIHRQNTLPPVVGTVLYTAHIAGDLDIRRPLLQDTPRRTGHMEAPQGHPATHEAQERRGGVAAMMSITAGKRPHIGHLLLATKARSILRGNDGDAAEIHIEANDTGPRMDAMLEAAAADTGESVDEIARAITLGRFALRDVERWYSTRHGGDGGMYVVPRAVPILHMRSQAQEIADAFGPLMGDVPVFAVNSSALSAAHVIDHSAPQWRDSGFETMEGSVLRKRGGPTSLLTRMSFIDHVATARPDVQLVYADSSVEINTAAQLSAQVSGYAPDNIKGAAIGLNFNIHSGSALNEASEALTIESFSDWYTSAVCRDKQQLVLDLEYLMTQAPIAYTNGSVESFYNFADVDSLKRAVSRMHSERLQLIERLADGHEIVTLPADEAITYRPEVSKAKQADIKKRLRSVMGQLRADNYGTYQVRDLDINTGLQASAVDSFLATMAAGTFTVTGDRRLVSESEQPLDSDLTAIMMLQGYTTKESLISAAQAMLGDGISFQFQLTPHQLLVRNIQEILSGVEGLGQTYQASLQAMKDRALKEMAYEKA